MNLLQILLSSRTFRLLFAVVLVGCGNEGGEAQGASLQDVPAVEEEQPSAEPEGFDLSDVGHNTGDEDNAILGIIEFSDFGCIHCAEFHRGTYPALEEEFVDGGEILWKYVPITIGGFPNGNLAGAAGVCALELGAFPTMRDHLFRNREEWGVATTGAATPILVRYATEVGLDPTAFRACLESPAPHETIEENNRIARAVGVSVTPSFIVGGSLVRGAPPLETFQAGLREILGDIRTEKEGGDERVP